MNETMEPRPFHEGTPSFEIELNSGWGEEKRLMNEVQQWTEYLGIPHGAMEDLKTICSEACLNAMEHGNGMRPNDKVRIYLTYEAPLITVKVLDRGAGIPLEMLSHCSKLVLTEECMSRGTQDRGWGLRLISQLAEYVGIVHDSGWVGLNVIYRIQEGE
jgi:serine/threonine-protein kinase RsbW